jgi:hypothetical protein
MRPTALPAGPDHHRGGSGCHLTGRREPHEPTAPAVSGAGSYQEPRGASRSVPAALRSSHPIWRGGADAGASGCTGRLVCEWESLQVKPGCMSRPIDTLVREVRLAGATWWIGAS